MTSLLPAFYISSNTEFADLYQSVKSLIEELGEDNVPLNFIDSMDFDMEGMDDIEG